MGGRLERGNQFPTAKAINIIQYWRRMGSRFLTFVGGEPTLHPDLPLLVQAARSAGFEKVMIDTNALLSERLMGIPKEDLFYVRVSLDGASAATHERVRGIGTFEKALNGIRMLIAAGYSVRITSTVFAFNAHESNALVELAARLGVTVVSFHSFTPEGLGAGNPDWSLAINDWIAFCDKLENSAKEFKIEVRYPPTWVRPERLGRLVDRGFKGCIGCTVDRLSIFPDGRCYICSVLFDQEIHFGNMTDTGFEVNTHAGKNEFELFTCATLRAERPELMGCPAESFLGHSARSSKEVVSVCRLWRTVIS